MSLSAALHSTSVEAILALANLKFDFAVLKIEAPVEFQGVGKTISEIRRKVAENGSTHVTARKLGALFENVIPDTPALIKAYGNRASEVMDSKVANPTKAGQYGFLQEHIGADATSLWAAATSGKTSIAMHLLACMLANVWNDLEATAIWEELVSRRNECLVESGRSTLLTEISITRDQLREWDASARSWLQYANKAFPKQHCHLTIVSNNSGLVVETGTSLYEDVIKAWTSALLTTEHLLQGESHEVMNGAILLALKSWHLYPDMLYLTETREFKQEDKLFPKGAIITVGVTSASPDRVGLSWSLPLGHLRYYGDPVVVTRSTTENASSVSICEFSQIILGSAVSHWYRRYDDFDLAVDLFVALSESLEKAPLLAPFTRKVGWFQLLTQTAVAYRNAGVFEKPELERFGALGIRKGRKFLAPREACPPRFFGFDHFSTLFQAFTNEEWQIDLLRQMAKDLVGSRPPRKLVIRYQSDELTRIFGRTVWEYASLLPLPAASSLGTAPEILRHRRWTLLAGDIKAYPCRCTERCVQTCPCTKDGFCGPNCHPDHCSQTGDIKDCGIRLIRVAKPREKAKNPSISWKVAQHAMALAAREECVEIQYDTAFREFDTEQFQWATYANEMKPTVPWGSRHTNLVNHIHLADDRGKEQNWTLLYGDSEHAAVFEQLEPGNNQPVANTPAINTVISCIKNNHASVASLDSYLVHLGYGPQSIYSTERNSVNTQYYSTLSFFAAVVKLYQQFPAAQVSLELLSRQPEIQWWHSTRSPNEDAKQNHFSLAEAFACITLLETGTVEVAPSSLTKVFAIARDNSLFAAKALLQDPWTVGNVNAIEHLNGNVGRPGLTLLIPPPHPKMKKLDVTGFSVLTHGRFDGNVHDAFPNTTLHLSFTKYEQPVSSNAYGEKDVRAYFRESLVSVLDRGDWIADLDVLGAREDPLLIRVPICKHDPNHWRTNNPYDEKETPARGLTAIDDWAELLDPPSIDGIVRTHKNLWGRLAATTMSIQKKKRMIVLPNEFCWKCVYGALAAVDKVPDLKYMTDSDSSEQEGLSTQRKSKKRKRAARVKEQPKAARLKESKHGAIIVS